MRFEIEAVDQPGFLYLYNSSLRSGSQAVTYKFSCLLIELKLGGKARGTAVGRLVLGRRYGGGTVLPWGGRGVAVGMHREGRVKEG